MEKTCLTCSSKFTGRADKKFCNEACKNDFHNQHSNRTGYGRQQFALAKKNHSILAKIEAAGLDQIGIRELELCGFNFEGLTGMKQPGKGSPELLCFDYSLKLSGKFYRIRKG